MTHENSPPIVIDQGSHHYRIGFGGHDAPKITLNCAIGDDDTTCPVDPGRKTLNIQNPMSERCVTDWDSLEKVWEHLLVDLIDSSTADGKYFLSGDHMSRTNKERMVEIAMEKFDVGGFMSMSSSLLSLYASGRVTGLVVDSGLSDTHYVPIYEGYALSDAATKTSVGGRHVTNYLKTLLDTYYTCEGMFDTHDALARIRAVKEKYAFVSSDMDKMNTDVKSNIERSVCSSYVLPDGEQLTIGREKHECTELLFQPSLIGSNDNAIHTSIMQSISRCDDEIKDEMFANIILSGGNTMFAGLKGRLQNEIQNIFPSKVINILAPADRSTSVWMGGSILASSCPCCTKSMWFTREDYTEHGPSAIHLK